MTMFTLSVLLPPPVDGDVATREFTYMTYSGAPATAILTRDTTETTFVAPRDASVVAAG